MKSTTGTQTSNAWTIRIGWVLIGLTSVNMIGDSLGKILPWHPAALLEEVQRLGESEIPLILIGLLQFTVAVVYLIPRTSILGAILMTGFLGGAEAIQIRVSGSGAFLIMLPLLLGLVAWCGVWLRDERLRKLIPLRAPLVRGDNTTTNPT